MGEKQKPGAINEPKPWSRDEYQKTKLEHDESKQRLKKQYLEKIREFYNQKKLEDPNFKLSMKTLEAYVIENPEKFPGIKKPTSLLHIYFNNSLTSLEISLGIRSVEEKSKH